MRDAVTVGAVLHAAALELLDGLRHVVGDGAELRVGHEAAGAEDLAETADLAHLIGRGNGGVEVEFAGLNLLHKLVGTHDVGTGFLGGTGSLALGATKLQTIWRVVLPTAFPNITTGLILSIGRVSGETAPILFTAAAYFLPKLPTSIYDQVMALPYHLYVIATSGTDLEATRPMAYGTALVLIVIVLAMNLLASFLRRHFGKKVKTN